MRSNFSTFLDIGPFSDWSPLSLFSDSQSVSHPFVSFQTLNPPSLSLLLCPLSVFFVCLLCISFKILILLSVSSVSSQSPLRLYSGCQYPLPLFSDPCSPPSLISVPFKTFFSLLSVSFLTPSLLSVSSQTVGLLFFSFRLSHFYECHAMACHKDLMIKCVHYFYIKCLTIKLA